MREDAENWRVRFKRFDEYPPAPVVYGPGGLITRAEELQSPQTTERGSESQDDNPVNGQRADAGSNAHSDTP